MYNLLKFINKDNITLALAIFGSIGTFISLFRQKKKINVKIIDYSDYMYTVQLLLLIENQSSLPLVISSISISSDNKNFIPCELIPKKIFKGINSSKFPINLQGYQGHQDFFEFLNFQDTPLKEGKNLVLQIYTNRGMITQSLILCNKKHYLNTSH